MGFPNRNANKFPAKAVKMFPDKNVVKNPEKVATKNQNKVAQPFTSAKSANKPNTVVNLAFSIYDLFPYFYSLHTIPTYLPFCQPILPFCQPILPFYKSFQLYILALLHSTVLTKC